MSTIIIPTSTATSGPPTMAIRLFSTKLPSTLERVVGPPVISKVVLLSEMVVISEVVALSVLDALVTSKAEVPGVVFIVGVDVSDSAAVHKSFKVIMKVAMVQANTQRHAVTVV